MKVNRLLIGLWLVLFGLAGSAMSADVPSAVAPPAATDSAATVNQAEEPLTLDDLVTLLSAGSTSEEILTELHKRGFSGTKGKETLTRLKKAGADVTLLLGVAKLPEKSSAAAASAPASPPPPDLPYGIIVPGAKLGFVKSPYSGKMVDVTGLPTGMEVLCPISKKPFRVPDQLAASAEAESELPFGTPVAGRPGYVNSPFARKDQLVDVSGMVPGAKVKCPYSGKLFRVPLKE